MLNRKIEAAGGIRRWASANSVNPGTASKAARGLVELTSAAMLTALGYRRKTVYEEIEIGRTSAINALL